MQNHPALPITLPPGNWGFHSPYLGYSSEFSPKSTNIMFRGLPMSFLVHEPKLCKVSNKTEERHCVILRDWGWCNWCQSHWPLEAAWAPGQGGNSPPLFSSDTRAVSKATWSREFWSAQPVGKDLTGEDGFNSPWRRSLRHWVGQQRRGHSLLCQQAG